MMNSLREDNWIWIERMIRKFPLPSFLFGYILFISLFVIYLYLDSKTDRLTLYSGNTLLWSAYQVLFTTILIPFELIAIEFLLNDSRNEFKKLDLLFSGSQTKFYKLLSEKITDQRLNYILLLILIGFPLIILGWSGLTFFKLDHNNIRIHLAIDILNNLLLIISIYLFCVILWIFINIYWAFHSSCRSLSEDLSKYNILIIQRRIVSIRNFFITILLIFIVAISALYISSMNTKYIVFNNYFLIALFLIAMISAAIGIKDAHGIIEKVIDQKLYFLDINVKAARMELESITKDETNIAESESAKRKIKTEKLEKMIELYEKDWDRITKEDVGLTLKDSIKEASAFVIGTIIPIMTFLISNKIMKLP
jgi:hypothetical protein